jgi:hypothetical protein
VCQQCVNCVTVMTAMNHKKSPFRSPKGAGVTVGEVLVLGAGIEPATRGFSVLMRSPVSP